MDEDKEPSRIAFEKKLELTVDDVLDEYVGSFGFSQLLQVFFVSLARMFDSQSTLVAIFADAQPDSWSCISPECSSACGMKAGTWEWSNGKTSTTVAEWGLVCERRFLAALPASLYFLGYLIGPSFFGHLANTFLGRKRAMLLSCLLTSVTTYLTSLSPNIWIYSFLRFSNGFSSSGIGICSLVLGAEAVGQKWHGQVGRYGFFFFTAGFLSVPLMAYPTRTYWRNLYKVLSFLPLVYTIFILVPFVSESPKWLLLRGRHEEALDVLKTHARMNGKELPSNLSLTEPSCYEKADLWSTKWAAKRMAMLMIIGFGIGFIYYGIQFNVENLSFNIYFTVAINTMMENTAAFIGSVLLSFMNRRLLFYWSTFLAGIFCILCIFFSKNRNGIEMSRNRSNLPQLMMETLGFMAASTAFHVLYVYCLELFLTSVRSIAGSMLRQGLMLGASISPLLVVVGRLSPSLSLVVFGLVAIVSGLLSLWLPETRNSPLYETLEQQEEEERFNCVCRNWGTELGKVVEA